MSELITFAQFAGFTVALFLILGAAVVCCIRQPWNHKKFHLYLWNKPGIGKVGRSYEDVKRDDNV